MAQNLGGIGMSYESQLTLNARKVIFLAQQEAKARGAKTVEPEHLFIGLISQSDCVAVYVLTRLSIDIDELRRRIDESIPASRGFALGDLNLSDAARALLSLSEEISNEMHDLFIGTDHILVALARRDGFVKNLLEDVGATGDVLISELISLQNTAFAYPLDEESSPADSPIIRVAQQILQESLGEAATEIHVISAEDEVRVGMMAYGSVSEVMTVPRHIVVPLMSRFRTMMNLPAPVSSKAVGTIRVSYNDRQYDLIGTFTNTEYGEQLVMRIVVCPGAEAIPEDTAVTAPSYTNVPSQRMSPPPGPSPIADVLNTHALRGRDLIGIEELTADEIMLILDVASRLKANKFDATQTQFAQGQTLAMLFEKPSLRTRVTFEAGMTQLGGHAIYLEGRLGIRETVPDVARNLDRWIDCIMARTFEHKTVLDLAEYARIPVINGLSDREHPVRLSPIS